MNGIMDKGEIVREYRAAKDKKKELGVLADLNECSKAEIAEILVEGGEKVDKRWFREPPKKKQWQTAEEIESASSVTPDSFSVILSEAKDLSEEPAYITVGKLAQMLAQLPPDLPVYIGANARIERLCYERLYTVARTSERVVLA